MRVRTSDLVRLAWLMNHYKQPYTHSMKELNEYRRKFKDGIIPQTIRPNDPEFEGPFFCRVISDLIIEQEKKYLEDVDLTYFRKLDTRYGSRRKRRLSL